LRIFRSGMKDEGGTTPHDGCRMRIRASAPRGASVRTSIFCWYHNSSQPALRASATSTGGLGGAFCGRSVTTLARRPSALNGVVSGGNILTPVSSPSWWSAFTMIDLAGQRAAPCRRTFL
jgi:hypothetical protein